MSGLLLLRRPSHVRCLPSRLSQARHYALIGKPQASTEPRWALPKTPARTRFAPSPTGYLHLGSLRTALYNYLLAQATGGQFIIRLEDTDQARLVSDAEQVLYDDLRWAGLHWDEGPDKGGPFGPYRQSERLALYTQHANALLESGHAFRCFCTKEALDFNVAQATAHGGPAHYPGTCTHVELGESDRRAANGEPHVVRFKAADRPVAALDLVYGSYKKAEREDSFIIMKSDGFPTYHFANVVDDHFMEITHVIRGAEWLISTPKHVELYNAFGWQPPNFAHVGLLVDAQRQKLSKRDMANIGIGVYRSSKILPEALLNFSALLGWDPNLQKNTHLDRSGAMTLDGMKQNFTMKFTRGDIVVDLTKLKFFQSKLIRSLISGENNDHDTLKKVFIQPILSELEKLDEKLMRHRDQGQIDDHPDLQNLIESISARPNKPALTEDYVLQVLRAWKGPIDDPIQFLYDNIFGFYEPSKTAMRVTYLELQKPMYKVMMLKGRVKLLNTDISKVLKKFTHELKAMDPEDWKSEKLGDFVKLLTDSVKFYDTNSDKDKFESAGWKFMRYALLNGKPGLAIVPMMQLLGQQETIHRIRSARKVVSAQEDKDKRAAERRRLEEEAAKVRIRFPGYDSLSKVAKHTAITRRTSQDIEPRNVKVVERKPSKKAPTPPGIGAFSIYINKEKDREERRSSKEGPFKSRAPLPPLSPKRLSRSPSEVQQVPQFLSRTEFRYGIRHLKDPDSRDAAFWKIEELQSLERAQRRELQAKEEASINAKERSTGTAWATPKAMLSQEKMKAESPVERGPLSADDPIPINHDDRVKHSVEVNREAAALAALPKEAEISEGPRSQASMEASTSPMYRSPAIGDPPLDPKAIASTSRAPFRDETSDAQPTDFEIMFRDALVDRDSAARDSAVRDSAARDSAARDSAARDSAARDSAARDSAARDSAARDSAARDSSSGDAALETAGMRPPGMRASTRERQVLRKSTPGPFKPAGVSPLADISKHVQHLRALNRSLALRKAKENRMTAKSEDSRRLEQFKASGVPSPLSRNSLIRNEAQELQTRGLGDNSQGDKAVAEVALGQRDLDHQAARLRQTASQESSSLGHPGKKEG